MFPSPKTTLAIALGLGISALALPATAQDVLDPAGMSCGDFLNLDTAGRTEAVNAARMAADSRQVAQGGMAGDTAMGDAGMIGGDMVSMVSTACEGLPDMMLSDAMTHTDM